MNSKGTQRGRYHVSSPPGRILGRNLTPSSSIRISEGSGSSILLLGSTGVVILRTCAENHRSYKTHNNGKKKPIPFSLPSPIRDPHEKGVTILHPSFPKISKSYLRGSRFFFLITKRIRTCYNLLP